MIRLIEAAIFLGLASAMHIAALSLPTTPEGATGGSSGGDDGASSVTLQAAPQSLRTLAQQWDQPPEIADMVALSDPATPDAPPQAAATGIAPNRTVPPNQPPAPQTAEAEPLLDPRLPAQPGLQPTAIIAPRAPDLPQPAAPPQHSAPTIAAPAPSPQHLQPAPDAAQAPTLDTAPADPRFAPTASLRPTARSAPPKPRTSQAQPAQRAKGAKTSGPQRAVKPDAAKPTASSGPSKATLQRAQAEWGARIRQSIARAQRYPRGTTARGIVRLRIAVNPSGSLRDVRVTASSGDAALDRAAVTAARAARLPRAPKSLTAASYSFNLPLQFARR